MNQDTMDQGNDSVAVMTKKLSSEHAAKVCPVDPAELAQCDSCQ